MAADTRISFMLIHVDAAQSSGKPKNQAEVLLRVQESTRPYSVAGEVFESLKIDMFRMRSGPCWPRWFAFFGMSGDRAVVDPQPAALLAEQFTPTPTLLLRHWKSQRKERETAPLAPRCLLVVSITRGGHLVPTGESDKDRRGWRSRPHLLVCSWTLTGASVTTFPGNSLSELVKKRET